MIGIEDTFVTVEEQSSDWFSVTHHSQTEVFYFEEDLSEEQAQEIGRRLVLEQPEALFEQI